MATWDLRLVPEQHFVRTGPVDHADWNHRQGVLGFISRQRFRLACDLLGDRHYDRMLEVGYGSGVFMPELARRCDELHGVDVHSRSGEVAYRLFELGVSATLLQASAADLPYDDESFDCIVAISALEFFPNLDAACVQMRRVLKRDGIVVAVTPADSPAIDFGLKLLTGADAREDYGERRASVIPTLARHFAVEAFETFPARWIPSPRLYRALRLAKPPALAFSTPRR